MSKTKRTMNIKKILEEDALYEEYEPDSDLIEKLITYSGSMDRFCPQCNKDSVFKTEKLRGFDFRGTPDNDFENPRIIQIQFYCSRNSSHLAFATFIRTIDKVIKAGQYPSTADNLKPAIERFKKDFKDDYEELRRAYGLADHDVGIGSYTYLRRVFERRLKSAIERKKTNDLRFDEESLEGLRIDEKINALKSELPEFLVKNKSIYSILSKGIHELTEEECISYFGVLSKSVQLLLEQELEIIEKTKLEVELSKEVNKINKKLAE